MAKVWRLARYLNCTVGSIPFSFLGFRVGINCKKATEWGDLIQKMKKKLKTWEDKKISLGGRIALIRAVLTSLPIYQLSFYQLPKKILNTLISLQRNFLWGW